MENSKKYRGLPAILHEILYYKGTIKKIVPSEEEFTHKKIFGYMNEYEKKAYSVWSDYSLEVEMYEKLSNKKSNPKEKAEYYKNLRQLQENKNNAFSYLRLSIDARHPNLNFFERCIFWPNWQIVGASNNKIKSEYVVDKKTLLLNLN